MQLEVADPPEVRVTTDGEQDTVRPDAGLTDSVRETLPANPPRLVRVTSDDPELPVWKPTVAGLAVIE